MPRFYFHLANPDAEETDEIGSLCPTADHAMIEAWRAAAEISTDLVRAGRSPAGYRFHVCDEAGRLVFELPFIDIMGGRPPRPGGVDVGLRTRLTETMGRSQRLQAELKASLTAIQETLSTTRALLAGRA